MFPFELRLTGFKA